MTKQSIDFMTRFERFYTHLTQADLEELADLYDEDILFIDPVNEHRGLTALQMYFENLLENCNNCSFEVRDRMTLDSEATITWQLNFEHPKLRRGKTITVPGISVLRVKDDGKIYFQQDYYDLGALLYEHVPVLGGVIRGLRKCLSA